MNGFGNDPNQNGRRPFESYFTGSVPGGAQPEPVPVEGSEDVIEVRPAVFPLDFTIRRVVVMVGAVSVVRRVMRIYVDKAGRKITCPDEMVVSAGCCGAALHVDSSITCDRCGRYLCRSCAYKSLVYRIEMICPRGCKSVPVIEIETEKPKLRDRLADY